MKLIQWGLILCCVENVLAMQKNFEDLTYEEKRNLLFILTEEHVQAKHKEEEFAKNLSKLYPEVNSHHIVQYTQCMQEISQYKRKRHETICQVKKIMDALEPDSDTQTQEKVIYKVWQLFQNIETATDKQA